MNIDYPRHKQRRTLIREESWPLVDGWYWCPPSVIEQRLEKAVKEFGEYWRTSLWLRNQKTLVNRIAHHCKDGKVRAPSYLQKFKRKNQEVSYYGKCNHCDEKLSTGLKMIIIMEQQL